MTCKAKVDTSVEGVEQTLSEISTAMTGKFWSALADWLDAPPGPLAGEAAARIDAKLYQASTTIHTLLAERDAALAEVARIKDALELINDLHIPDQPAAVNVDELTWAKMHTGRLRRIARDALKEMPPCN